MLERLFGLDPQLLFDAFVLAVNIFILFLVASYNLFEPARNLLKKREERIAAQLDSAKKDMEDAKALKEDYENRIANIEAEADEILAKARKSAVKNEELIIAQAKEEASRILKRADNQIELEKKKAADDIKNEIIDVATVLASKVLEAEVDENKSKSLIDDTLREIGESTWQNQ